MKRPALVFGAVLALASVARADPPVTLTQPELDDLNKSGCFTPAFQKAVHELIDSQAAAEQAKARATSLRGDLPALQAQADSAEAALADKRKSLALYSDPEGSDFAALGRIMADAQAKPEDQVAAAQAFLWIYPASLHATDAQADLTTAQNKIATLAQQAKDAEAARAAAQQKMLDRVKAHDLTLDEWGRFLEGKSQEELVGLLGRPSAMNPDLWVYVGAWATAPNEPAKVGLQIIFNGGRVMTVTAGPAR